MFNEGQLVKRAEELRELIVKMLTTAGSGHVAGPMGSADFWVSLYFGDLIKLDANDPWREDRDRVVLSAGHYAPALYGVLAMKGYFLIKELETLRKLGSRLQGHPVAKMLPGVEVSSGPLGQGISQAVGMALAAKKLKKNWRVICVMGDGEQQEGQVWEAYMSAAKYELDNLLIVIDRNNIQIDGFTEKVMPLEPLAEKYNAFNLHTLEVDGHNFRQIHEAFSRWKVNVGKPTVLILKTTPGRGVEFMENNAAWHGKAPSLPEAIEALQALRKMRTLNSQIVND